MFCLLSLFSFLCFVFFCERRSSPLGLRVSVRLRFGLAVLSKCINNMWFYGLPQALEVPRPSRHLGFNVQPYSMVARKLKLNSSSASQLHFQVSHHNICSIY